MMDARWRAARLLAWLLALAAQAVQETIEDTEEFKRCAAGGECTVLNLSNRQLNGTVPDAIGTFVGLRFLCGLPPAPPRPG